MNINIIVAYCKNNGIGFENKMPWHIKSDLKKFQKLTIGNGNNANIMGKNTYNSILNINKNSLKNRDNLILSTSLNVNTKNITNNVIKSFNNIQNLENFIKTKKYEEVWIIGGEKIYNYFLNIYPANELLTPKNIYITFINNDFECDTFFPTIDLLKYKFVSQEIHSTDANINTDTHNLNIFDIIYTKIGNNSNSNSNSNNNNINNINDHNKDCQ